MALCKCSHFQKEKLGIESNQTKAKTKPLRQTLYLSALFTAPGEAVAEMLSAKGLSRPNLGGWVRLRDLS